MKDANGVKVGILGLTTQSKLLAGPKPCVIESPTDAAQAAVAALQAAGAQVIVAISHAGMYQARTLAATVPGIDVIVNGHDNALLDQPEVVARPGSGFTWIVSAGAHYGWVGRLRLSWTGSGVNFVDYALTPVDASIMPDPATQGRSSR
jgi:2',3'-cyclic-nucleotide 2'-phosphodiesterase (5'-nucleotidase family)